MGKVKEHMLFQLEQEFEDELSYQEYIEEEYRQEELRETAKKILAPYYNENFYLYVCSVNDVEYKSGLSSS